MAHKSSLGRDNTMRNTAKEAMQYLYPHGNPGTATAYMRPGDIQMMQSQGLMDKDPSTSDSPSKPKMQRDSTMAVTAKEAKGLLGDGKLGDTRQETSKQKKSSTKKTALKRGSTIAATLAEAEYVLDGKKIDVSEGRKTRSGGRKLPPKPSVKRAGTMQKTAKEGKSFLKRGKGKGKK